MQRNARVVNRARIFAATTFLLFAAAAGIQSARAQACGAQADFLVRSDPLLAAVRPVDCATVLQALPDFAWPSQGADNVYTVSLRFPDGHIETRSTPTNWLAWHRAIPAGRYSWSVSVAGAANHTGANRSFFVDTGANDN